MATKKTTKTAADKALPDSAGSQASVSDIIKIAKVPKFLILTERNMSKIQAAFLAKGDCLTETETVNSLF